MADDVTGAGTATTTPAQTTGTDTAATTDGTGSVVTGAAQQPDPKTVNQGQKTDADGTKEGDGQKADGEKKDGDGEEKPDADKPIEYTEFKLPDGVKADEEALSTFKEISQEAKIPQDVAQKYVDLYANKVKAAVEAPYKAWAETQEKWVTEIKADPEVGGDKLNEAVAACGRAIEAFGGTDAPKLREALIFTGAGNNPMIMKFFARVGKAVTADNKVTPGTGNQPPKSAAELFYPSMTKE